MDCQHMVQLGPQSADSRFWDLIRRGGSGGCVSVGPGREVEDEHRTRIGVAPLRLTAELTPERRDEGIAAVKDALPHLPTMESLFGAMDFCDCADCRVRRCDASARRRRDAGRPGAGGRGGGGFDCCNPGKCPAGGQDSCAADQIR